MGRSPAAINSTYHDGETRGYYAHGQPKAGDYVASCYPPRLYGGRLAVVLWSPGVCLSNYFAVSISVVGTTTVAGCCSCRFSPKWNVYGIVVHCPSPVFGTMAVVTIEFATFGITTLRSTVTTTITSGTAFEDAYYIAYAAGDFNTTPPPTPTPLHNNSINPTKPSEASRHSASFSASYSSS